MEGKLPSKADFEETLEQLDPSVIDKFTVEGSDNSLSENSRESYKGDVRRFNRWLKENDRTVTEDSLRDYFSDLKETSSAATLNRKKYALIRALKAHYSGDTALQTVVERVAKKAIDTHQIEQQVDKDEVPTVDEVQELIRLCTDEEKDDLALIIRFLWTTAVRISELINIRLNDIQEGNKRMKIKIRGKGNKERTVKIGHDFYESIRDEFNGEKRLFENRNGNPFNRSNIYKRLQRLNTSIKRNPHCFRHARVHFLIDNGISLKAVSNLLGHSNIVVLLQMYYSDQVDYDELEVIDPIDGI